jgi:hypothetical protein
MAELIYTTVPASIPKFLKHIQSAGVPEKVTVRYLEGVGFKSTNDRYLISVMKALKLIDVSGNPTEDWKAYRDKSKSKDVLGRVIREAYSDLFATYPDADRKDTEAIRNFFSARSKVAETTLRLAVATFKALAAEASFSSEVGTRSTAVAAASPAPFEAGFAPLTVEPDLLAGPRDRGRRDTPSVNINIELHLPETDNADVYDKLFAAMRKHLFD